MIHALIYYAPSVLFIIALALYIYSRLHVRRHLFVVHCPLCRRDPYRMAVAAEQLGLVPEGSLVSQLEEEDDHDR